MKLNKGILLYGPPRRDKTLIASALANEIDAHYLKIGADDLTTSLVGETEKNWRDLFKKAKDNQPAILFIGEFDAISKERTGTETSRYQDSLVSQILNLMSDLEKSDYMFFVITKEIFKIHSRQEKLDKNLDVNELCKKNE